MNHATEHMLLDLADRIEGLLTDDTDRARYRLWRTELEHAIANNGVFDDLLSRAAANWPDAVFPVTQP